MVAGLPHQKQWHRPILGDSSFSALLSNKEYQKSYAEFHHPKGIGFFIPDKAAFPQTKDAENFASGTATTMPHSSVQEILRIARRLCRRRSETIQIVCELAVCKTTTLYAKLTYAALINRGISDTQSSTSPSSQCHPRHPHQLQYRSTPL